MGDVTDIADLVPKNPQKSYNLCTRNVNLKRGANAEDGISGNGDSIITRDLMKPSLNKTNMEFIYLLHTRELRDI